MKRALTLPPTQSSLHRRSISNCHRPNRHRRWIPDDSFSRQSTQTLMKQRCIPGRTLMLARRFPAVPMFLFCSALVAQAQITTAITGARVIDGTGTPAHIETVIIRDNRIVAVSDRAEIPAGTRILDATGQTLMPGLFDLHTHLNASGTDAVDDFGKSLKAYLICGVTSLNDYSVYGEMLAPLRPLQSSGVLVGPNVNFAIPFVP